MTTHLKEQITVIWFIPENLKTRLSRLIGRSPWHPNHSLASVWIRGFQLARYLKNYGFMVYCNELPRIPDVAIFLRRHAAKDVALAQRLKAKGTRIITDVIVNYFEPRSGYGPHRVGGISKQAVESFKELVQISDQIWCVSPFLQKLALKYNPISHFVTDSVDPLHFNPRLPAENDPPIVGWSGYSVKAEPLDLLKPWIEEGKFRLLLISDKPPDLGFPYEFKKWQYATFPMNISKCDLCVAPRNVENSYDRGHSVFKIAVFMAMGVPALAGPVSSYELLLGNGRGGAICRSFEDWAKWLNRFLSDSDLRARWRSEALEAVKPFLTPVVAEQVSNLLWKLVG